MGNPYHRPGTGQFGTRHEQEAFEIGRGKGLSQGIAIGVALAAKALALPLELLWALIRGGKNRNAA
jgi:hypothetical protein